MNLLTSQVIIIIAILGFALYVFRLRTALTDTIVYLTLASGGILLVLHPDLSTYVGNQIGVGRGTDLLLYVFIIFSLFYYLSLYSRFKSIERQITMIVRAMAMAEAMNGPQNQVENDVKSLSVNGGESPDEQEESSSRRAPEPLEQEAGCR